MCTKALSRGSLWSYMVVSVSNVNEPSKSPEVPPHPISHRGILELAPIRLHRAEVLDGWAAAPMAQQRWPMAEIADWREDPRLFTV